VGISTNQLHTTNVVDWLDIEDYAGATITLAAGEVNSAALAEGVYEVNTDTVCYIKVGPSAAGVTTSTGLKLSPNVPRLILIRQGSRINSIAGGAGVLNFHKVA
jgi:hypothetical protein